MEANGGMESIISGMERTRQTIFDASFRVQPGPQRGDYEPVVTLSSRQVSFWSLVRIGESVQSERFFDVGEGHHLDGLIDATVG